MQLARCRETRGQARKQLSDNGLWIVQAHTRLFEIIFHIMKSFFPLGRGEGATLVFLIAFAAFAFIPTWRTIELGGMAVFGWLIAALMLISPAVALMTILRRDGTRGVAPEGSGGESAGGVERDGGET